MVEEEGTIGEEQNLIISSELARQERINRELAEANQYYKTGDVENWKMTLDVLYREIHAKLSKEEKEEFKTMLNEITKIYQKFDQSPKQQATEFFGKLNKLDLKIREFLDKQSE